MKQDYAQLWESEPERDGGTDVGEHLYDDLVKDMEKFYFDLERKAQAEGKQADEVSAEAFEKHLAEVLTQETKREKDLEEAWRKKREQENEIAQQDRQAKLAEVERDAKDFYEKMAAERRKRAIHFARMKLKFKSQETEAKQKEAKFGAAALAIVEKMEAQQRKKKAEFQRWADAGSPLCHYVVDRILGGKTTKVPACKSFVVGIPAMPFSYANLEIYPARFKETDWEDFVRFAQSTTTSAEPDLCVACNYHYKFIVK